MKASIVDLRYKINDILKALDRNESVTVLYHGKIKDHPLFGMTNDSEKTVLEELANLRKLRHDL
ncbi:MAG TPA: type II toxin-antitoxin system Phd/YefM family antitoxin [Gammaproteobacteria bacterium]|nr:type II toxin-antitoxin system Phd/YefM family antitoxin [Gammaproteobacteria bacterium]